MKTFTNFINENVSSKEEVRDDYYKVDILGSKKEKLEFAHKYGIESVKKVDIQQAILLKLRDLRKSASIFDKNDYHDFIRLIPDSLIKLPDYLKEENPKFVEWLQKYYLENKMKGNLKNWIGINPGRDANYHLSYADIHTVKFYNKILEFIANNTPKTRTTKDEIFDMLVNKFTNLLEDYKKEYLQRVEDFAKKRYSEILPKELDTLKEKYKESINRLNKIDWRTERSKFFEEQKVKDSLNRKIEQITKIFNKYTEKTYAELCVNEASEEFENNIKVLSHKIQEEELEVDKLDVKSIHDDPKVFNMKISDGNKNLFCRSVLAAQFSNYMRPHYRFIITNRAKDDSKYDD